MHPSRHLQFLHVRTALPRVAWLAIPPCAGAAVAARAQAGLAEAEAAAGGDRTSTTLDAVSVRRKRLSVAAEAIGTDNLFDRGDPGTIRSITDKAATFRPDPVRTARVTLSTRR